MSHLSLEIFFDVDSKSIIVNLSRFDRKFEEVGWDGNGMR